MKLDRIAGFAVVAVALFAIEGCASHTTQPAAPKVVLEAATTQLMAAELSESDDAPRVGKSHHSSVIQGESQLSEDADAKDAPRRDERKHNGGGFSGWK